MKTIAGCALALLVSTSAFAAPSKDEAKRLDEGATLLTELRSAPDTGVPEDLWGKADCVIVIPNLKKAAFVVGGEYGSGVMSCRHANGWSAPVFMQLAKGSWGLQIGAQEIDLVLLVMNDHAVQKLLDDKVALGADASVAAGPVGRAASAATDAQLKAEMLAYSRSKGLFAGIDLSGGVLRPDQEALECSYGPSVTAHQLVSGDAHVTMPGEAKAFTNAVGREVRATTGQH